MASRVELDIQRIQKNVAKLRPKDNIYLQGEWNLTMKRKAMG